VYPDDGAPRDAVRFSALQGIGYWLWTPVKLTVITLAIPVALLFLAAPLDAQALQSAKMAQIGFLSLSSPSGVVLWRQAFRQGLTDLGWVEGENVRIEYRYAEGRIERLPDLAADLVRLKVDVIVTALNTDALAAQKATSTIPIVMASAADPIGTGLVESLARPGGNITGLTSIVPELAGKRLELLKEVVPNLSRVAVLWNPQGRTSTLSWKELQLPARRLGIELRSLEVRSVNAFDKAVADAARTRAGALAIMPDPVFVTNLKRIADLAAKSRLPSIYNLSEFVDAGGLVSYGPDQSDSFRRAATYVDKILKGAKPADLPVEQATKFELVINLKTAKALGLSIPPLLLLRADRVIE
jgi:ABC-type uncharacterized transport system substrate-binding protein